MTRVLLQPRRGGMFIVRAMSVIPCNPVGVECWSKMADIGLSARLHSTPTGLGLFSASYYRHRTPTGFCQLRLVARLNTTLIFSKLTSVLTIALGLRRLLH
jgi:hypothetical protein